MNVQKTGPDSALIFAGASWLIANLAVVDVILQFIVLMIGLVSGCLSLYWHWKRWKEGK